MSQFQAPFSVRDVATILKDFIHHPMEVRVRPPALQCIEAFPESQPCVLALSQKISHQLLCSTGSIMVLLPGSVALKERKNPGEEESEAGLSLTETQKSDTGPQHVPKGHIFKATVPVVDLPA